MTWADYIAWWHDPVNIGHAIWNSIWVFIAYHIGLYVGRKERK